MFVRGDVSRKEGTDLFSPGGTANRMESELRRLTLRLLLTAVITSPIKLRYQSFLHQASSMQIAQTAGIRVPNGKCTGKLVCGSVRKATRSDPSQQLSDINGTTKVVSMVLDLLVRNEKCVSLRK